MRFWVCLHCHGKLTFKLIRTVCEVLGISALSPSSFNSIGTVCEALGMSVL